MQVERDAEGRVVAVYGPGTNRRRVSYEAGVRVEDTLGTTWSAFEDDQRVWVVRDGVGRQVRMELDPQTGRISRGRTLAVSSRRYTTEGTLLMSSVPAGLASGTVVDRSMRRGISGDARWSAMDLGGASQWRGAADSRSPRTGGSLPGV